MRTRTRFILLIFFLITAFAGASFHSQNTLLRDHLRAGQSEWLDTLVRALAEAVTYDVVNDKRSHAQYLLNRVASEDVAIEYVYVTNFDQQLFVHTFEGGFPQALASKAHFAGTSEPKYLSTTQGNIVEYSTPLIEGMDAYLHIGTNDKEIDMLFAKYQAIQMPLITISLIISLGLAILISRSVSKPLRSLSSQVTLYGKTGKVQKIDTDTSEPDVKNLALAFDKTIAERDKIELELRIATENALEANAAKSQFLASMSHELRTPLNAIMGFSEVLSQQLLGPLGVKKYKEYAHDIYNSAEHLQSLIEDVLDLSSIEAGKTSLNKEPISINAVCAECIHLFKAQPQENEITTVVNLDETVSNINADKRAVKQIIINLLQNATKFTPAGGQVSVTTTPSKLGIKIIIANTGIGISKEMLSKLTLPFTKGEDNPLRTSKGWGLGLAICKSLVELHGGEITFESVPNKETTVTVNLPSK